MRQVVWSIWLVAMVGTFALASCGNGENGGFDCKGDAICEQCGEDAWCYEGVAVERSDPELCPNISDLYGEGAIGVEGQCFMDIACKTDNCSLCSRIEKDDIRNHCNDECPDC